MSRRLLPLLLLIIPFGIPPSVPAEALQRALTAEPARPPVSGWQLPPTRRKVVLHGIDIDSYSASIPPNALPVLDAAVEILSKGGGVIQIVTQRSEASSEPFDAAREELRATMVQQYLVQHGIAADRILVHGPDMPPALARHATAEGAAEDLRVELHGD